jgi:hypothetical protein
MNDDRKDSFYDELGRVFDQFPRYNMKILLGDFNAKVGREALKYGSETWVVLNERDKQCLEVAQMRFLRPLLVYTKLDRQRNVDIRERLKVQNIVEEILTYQKNFKEHVERMQDGVLPKLALKCQPVGK